MNSKIEVTDSRVSGIPTVEIVMGIAIVIVGLLAIAYFYAG